MSKVRAHPTALNAPAYGRAITDLAWSPFKQHTLASRSADAEIPIWDVRTKTIKVHCLQGQTGTVAPSASN